MENKELAVINNSVSLADMRIMADAMSKSRLFPSCQTPENALALMLLCQSEGIHPAQAVRRFHVIKGTCSMRADAMLAEFQRQGGRIQWMKYDAIEARAKFSHAQGGEVEFSYTMKEAEKAGLVKAGSGWTNFPAAMLRARCISGGIRMVLPGVVCGIYTPEEVSDFDTAFDKPAKNAKPEKATKEPAPVVEAEIVKEPLAATEATQTSTVSPIVPPASPNAEKTNVPVIPPTNDAQIGKHVADQLAKIRNGAAKLGCKNQDEIRAFIGGLIGHEIKSATELTEQERQDVIAAIEIDLKQGLAPKGDTANG